MLLFILFTRLVGPTGIAVGGSMLYVPYRKLESDWYHAAGPNAESDLRLAITIFSMLEPLS